MRMSPLINAAIAASVIFVGACGSKTESTSGVSQATSDSEASNISSMSVGSCGDLVKDINQLKDGFKWTEGPAWDPERGRWVLSDVMGDTEYAVSPSGELTTLREKAGYPNGHARLSDGTFVVAQHDRTINTETGDGEGFVLLHDTYEGKKLNSPNDVAVGSDDSIYFTDPPFGIQGFGPQKAESALGYSGVFKVSGGMIQLLNKDLATPNGIGISNDQSTLYISDTGTNSLYTLDLTSFQGEPIAAEKLVELLPIEGGGEGHGPDGLRVATDGSIWASGKGGINVVKGDGALSCSIPFPNHVANLAFGGEDDKQILVTSADKLYTINLK
jgi:gluconolactonase